tara:strand:- start:2684 stop:2941 length:258 start_codon:yes stop_codon:yes gene_type:complete
MEERLRANDHKGGWKQMEPTEIFNRILEELKELVEAQALIDDGSHFSAKGLVALLRESADLANFAMFLADNNACLGMAGLQGDDI